MAPRCAILSYLRDLNRGQATPGSQTEKSETISAWHPIRFSGSATRVPERGVILDEGKCRRFRSHWDVAFAGSVRPVGPGQAPGLFRSRWTINSKGIHKIRQIAQLSSLRV